jgi:CRISPR/Cas system-associated exonuclease Cas4 (RecB family)
MKTLCMVTREPLEWDDCLSCAAQGLNTCGWDYALLRAMKQDDDRKRVGYHVTEIKACLRKAYYTRTEESRPQFPSDRMYMVLGTMTHQILENSDHAIWAEVPVQIKLGHHALYGTVDVYSPTLRRVVDYKTTRSIKPWGLPYGEHEEQVKIYTLMLRAMGLPVLSAAIQYIDLSGPSKCPYCKQGTLSPGNTTFTCRNCGKDFDNDRLHNGAALYEVELDDKELCEIEQALKARLETLDHALAEKDPPPAEPGWLCRYCTFRSICPQTADAERDLPAD